MIAKLNRTSSRSGWALRALVLAIAVAVLGLPVVYFSTGAAALAQDPFDDDSQASASAADEPAVEFLPRLSPSEEKILTALDQPTEMDFNETPLGDAVDYLKHLHKIDIQLDNRALEDAAIGSDTPVTRTVKAVRLKSGLRLLLRYLDLTYIIKNEVLLITTPDRAEAELLTLTYPVGDLAGGDYDTLIDTVTTAVKPQTWDEVGGPGSISEVPTSKCVVISQTREVHDEVLTLLRALRAARKAAD